MKERIIGAAILVSIVVLVVPIFLDGPPGEGAVVSERVLLPGQEEQDIKTVVLDRERSVPVPAANRETATTAEGDPTATPPDTSAPATSKPVTASPETAKPAISEPAPAAVVEATPARTVSEPPKTATPAATASSTGMWAVQLGSFSNKDNAEKLAADLRKQGYAAFLSQLAKDGADLHRVRIGPQKNRDSAEAMAVRLQKVGHKGQVVPHP